MASSDAAVGLATLPEELYEMIVLQLYNENDIHSIGALRITSRLNAWRASQGCFRRIFKEPTLVLLPRKLKKASLAFLTLGKHTKILRVAAVERTVSQRTAAEDFPDVFTLLIDCFSALKQSLDTRSLFYLSYWPTYTGAGNSSKMGISEMILNAVQLSGLSVERLSLLYCTVPLRVFTNLAVPKPPFATLEYLSLSMSEDGDQILADSQDNFIPSSIVDVCALQSFLKVTAYNLRAIELEWRPTSVWKHNPTRTFGERFFDKCHDAIASLRQLLSFQFHGLRMSEHSLLTFLNKTSARLITLSEVYLYGGSWERILQVITRTANPFKDFVLNDLKQWPNGTVEERPYPPSTLRFRAVGDEELNIATDGKRICRIYNPKDLVLSTQIEFDLV